MGTARGGRRALALGGTLVSKRWHSDGRIGASTGQHHGTARGDAEADARVSQDASTRRTSAPNRCAREAGDRKCVPVGLQALRRQAVAESEGWDDVWAASDARG